MNLEELGMALRAEREERGLSLEEVADRLKISARHVRALEEADVASLPHPAYTKGFLRAYAGLLGLAQTELDEALHSLSPQENITPAQTVYVTAVSRRSFLPGRLLTMLLALLVILGVLYALWSTGLLQEGVDMLRGDSSTVSRVARPAGLPSPSSEDRLAGADPLAVVPVLPLTETPVAPPAVPQSVAATPDAASPEASAAHAVSTSTPDAVSASATPADDPVVAERPEVHDTAVAADGTHQVELIATGACWVLAHADKLPARQFSLDRGGSVTLTFDERLDLRLGNAGGVRILYDGQEQPSPGTAGQVRNLVFPPRS